MPLVLQTHLLGNSYLRKIMPLESTGALSSAERNETRFRPERCECSALASYPSLWSLNYGEDRHWNEPITFKRENKHSCRKFRSKVTSAYEKHPRVRYRLTEDNKITDQSIRMRRIGFLAVMFAVAILIIMLVVNEISADDKEIERMLKAYTKICNAHTSEKTLCLVCCSQNFAEMVSQGRFKKFRCRCRFDPSDFYLQYGKIYTKAHRSEFRPTSTVQFNIGNSLEEIDVPEEISNQLRENED